MKKTIIIILLSINQLVSATNYYVSNSSGSDAAGRNGRSESAAWKSISKVNSMTFAPGDSILFKRGDTWRETLVIPSSGSDLSNIVFGCYGTGPNPIFLGSGVPSGWTNLSGNIWVSVSSFSNPRSQFNCDLFFLKNDGTVNWGKFISGTGSLVSEFDWTWSGNKIYVYAPSDPAALYKGIEIPQRQACIDLNNREHLVVTGIDMHYAIYEGITYDWNFDQINLHGLLIENCNIGYIGGNITYYTYEYGFGIDVAYSDMTVRNCEIHNCGRRGISFHLYGSGFTVSNVMIEKNYFHDGYHTTGVDISVGSGTYTGSFNGVTIRRNLFFDPPGSAFHSEQIFIQNYNYSTLISSVKNINIYSNIFKSPSASSIMVEGSQSVYIYNNTFYNHNITKTANLAHLWIDANNALIKIKNNIFYTELGNDIGGCGLEIFSLTDPSKIESDYNLYYRTNNALRIVKVNSTNYYMSSFSAIRTQLGWELNSPIPASPLFSNPGNNDFSPGPGSPAISAGVNLNLPVDYYGNSFGSNPNIGCTASIQVSNLPPQISISSPEKNSGFFVPATVTIRTDARDNDGTISKVEFFAGGLKLGESLIPPFSFTWKDVPAGTYQLTAIATDNKSATSCSEVVNITVSVLTSDDSPDSGSKRSDNSLLIYPNPNDGHFSVIIHNLNPGSESYFEIFNSSGKKICSQSVNEGETESKFDLSHLSSGMYILRLNSSAGISYQKFIIRSKMR